MKFPRCGLPSLTIVTIWPHFSSPSDNSDVLNPGCVESMFHSLTAYSLMSEEVTDSGPFLSWQPYPVLLIIRLRGFRSIQNSSEDRAYSSTFDGDLNNWLQGWFSTASWSLNEGPQSMVDLVQLQAVQHWVVGILVINPGSTQVCLSGFAVMGDCSVNYWLVFGSCDIFIDAYLCLCHVSIHVSAFLSRDYSWQITWGLMCKCTKQWQM